MAVALNRVLITGLNGFTGKHLAQCLRNAGYEVHGTIFAGHVSDERCHIADLAKIDDLRAVIKRVSPHHVVHLAAVSNVAHDDAEAIYKTNIVGTRNLLRALVDFPEVVAGLRTVLLASSANIYGNTSVDPIGEDERPNPANDYAISKLAMEQMAALWVAKLPITVVRPFNYTGVGQSSAFLIPKIVEAFAHKSKFLELGNLDVARDFSDVRDVVIAYRELLEQSPRGTFNVCAERAFSLREVLQIVSELSGHSVDVRVNPAFVRANEVKSLRGSAGRLRGQLPNWQPRPLRETINWMLQAYPK